MIPDFKTYIRESIWADMEDRGTGDMVKKEDDVDQMSLETFYEYMKGKYKTLYYHDPIEYNDSNQYIAIPIFKHENTYSFLNYVVNSETYIEFDIKFIKKINSKAPQIVKGLRDNFSVEMKDSQAYQWTEIRITPKDGSEITNSFVLQVTDNLIESVSLSEKGSKGFYKLIEKNEI